MTADTVTSDPSMIATAACGTASPVEMPSPELLVLSAASASDLDTATARLRHLLSGPEAPRMRDVAYTLRTGCKELAHRRMLVCSSREDALATLVANNPNRLFSSGLEQVRRPAVFMLPGIGDQYVGMGHGLYAGWDVFREQVDTCARILEPYLGTDIRSVLYPASQSWKNTASGKGIDLKRMLGRSADEAPDPDTARLNTTALAQPALFTMEYATARLWMSLGVTPDAMVGHSMGEYVAACLAEVMSLEDALRLIAVRAQLVNTLPEAVMLAVMLSEEDLRPILPPGLFISLLNGPTHCVVAGPPAEAAAFEQTLKEREVIARRVQNGHAFHTSMLQPILGPFEAEVGKVRFSEPRIPYLSNVTGDWVTASQATNPSYWLEHASHTARFSDGLRRMWQLPNPALIECGPGKTLNALAAQHPDRKGTLRGAIWSMRQRYENESDDQVLLTAIGKVWLAGAAIGWDRIPARGEPQRIRLTDAEPIATCARDGDAAGRQSCALAEAPDKKGGAPDGGWTANDAPANERERQLVEIWKTALGQVRIGVNDSFGALGGDSLSSVSAIMEMKRLGIPDDVARGLYQGLTIRQMAQLAAEGGSAPQSRRVELSSVDTPIFFRAWAIYLVLASHLGMTNLGGHWILLMISGLNFAKFQLRTINKERNVTPVFRLMLRLAIPCFIFTVLCQAWDYAAHGIPFKLTSWLFLDNLTDPRPFKGGESPWFIDLLLQCWLILAVLLAPRFMRQFAVKRTYEFGLIFLAASWLVSVVVPFLIGDPHRVWTVVPHEYLWLVALGWFCACCGNDRQRILASVLLVLLNAIDLHWDVGNDLGWQTVAAGLAIIWFDELPAQLPRVVVQVLIGAAGASLFIYLTQGFSFHLLRIVWKDCPSIIVLAWAMLGGFAAWTLWNHITRISVQWFRRLGVAGGPDLGLSTTDN